MVMKYKMLVLSLMPAFIQGASQGLSRQQLEQEYALLWQTIRTLKKSNEKLNREIQQVKQDSDRWYNLYSQTCLDIRKHAQFNTSAQHVLQSVMYKTSQDSFLQQDSPSDYDRRKQIVVSSSTEH